MIPEPAGLSKTTHNSVKIGAPWNEIGMRDLQKVQAEILSTHCYSVTQIWRSAMALLVTFSVRSDNLLRFPPHGTARYGKMLIH
jgi:hypothetical protein